MAGTVSQARRRGYVPGRSGDSLLMFVGSRWKVWSEREATVQVSHSDSSETYTAACWGEVGSQSGGKERDPFIALGCAGGRVQVWNPLSGELIGPVAAAFHDVAQGSDCAVTALAPAQVGRAAIFVGCRGVPDVLEVGVLDGKTRRKFKADKSGTVQLAVNLSGTEWLVSASGTSALKLWSVTAALKHSDPNVKTKPHMKLTGPANPVTCLDIASTRSEALVLCCDGQRQVDVFTCSEDRRADGAEKQPPKEANIVLSSHERISFARFVTPLARDASVVGYGASQVLVWSFRSLSDATATIAPSLAVTQDLLGGSVLCARPVDQMPVAAAVKPGTPLLRVVYGSGAHPSFAEVRSGETPGTPAIVPIGSAPTKKTAQEATRKEEASLEKGPTVLGPLEVTAPRQRAQKRAREEDDPEVAAEIARAAKEMRTIPASGNIAAPSGALSLAPLVRQGLRAKDTDSLDAALKNMDRKIVDSTAADLTGPEAFDLLQECTKRLLRWKGNGTALGQWVQLLLVRHAAYIGSQPALRHALEPLSDAIEVRVASFQPLLRLKGRLRLLQNLGKAAQERKKESVIVREALLEYKEGDEDRDDLAEEDDEELLLGAKGGSSDEDEGSDLDEFDDIFDEED